MHVGQSIAGKYVIEGVLGTGGMGVVYLARDLVLERAVAIKVLLPDLAEDPRVQERFRREAIAAARVCHPNVISIVEYGRFDKARYLVMEYIPGRTLGRLLADNGAVSFERARALVDQLLAALAATHASGVVHGDIKSENLVVTVTSDLDEHATLIDFGLAQLRGHSCVDYELSGTPEYLAPERIRGQAPTASTDLYAAGATLYELLCGVTPFEGGRSSEIFARHLEEPIPPLANRPTAGPIPKALDALIAWAMDKDPATRIGSASEFRAALAAIPHVPDTDKRPLPSDHRNRSTQPWTAGTEAVRCALGSPVGIRSIDRRNDKLDRTMTDVKTALLCGQPENIVEAYLERAQALVSAHDLVTASSELERALEIVAPHRGARPFTAWRLFATLATIQSSLGNHVLAEQHARTAIEYARSANSYAGHVRGWALLEQIRHDAR